MKIVSKSLIFIAFLILIISCADKKQSADSIIQIDVSKIYPEKILFIEDIADIEYIQMEFHDDYLFSSSPRHVSSSTVMFRDNSTNDFLFFTGDGKPKSKFNHFGQGPGEYSMLSFYVYDEEEDRLYVLSNNNLLVYSSTGNLYYSLPLPENARINSVFDFDKESLIIHHQGNVYNTNFVRISKKDASVVAEINITDTKYIDLAVREGMVSYGMGRTSLLRHKDGFLITDFSKDTVFFYGNNNKLSPALIRTPSIFEMDPYIYLNSFVETGGYVFLMSVTVKVENGRFPVTFLMIDKEDHSVYKQKILLKDYEGKVVDLSTSTITNNDSGTGLISLSLFELKKANEENKLRGKLKEMVEASNDDSNDIYMILHFK